MTKHDSSSRTVGLYVPPYVMECPDLSFSDWLFLAQVIQLSRGGRGCYATTEYLGRTLRLADRTLRQIIRNLRERGLLTRVGKTLRPAAETDPIWTGSQTRTHDTGECDENGDRPNTAAFAAETGHCDRPKTADFAAENGHSERQETADVRPNSAAGPAENSRSNRPNTAEVRPKTAAPSDIRVNTEEKEKLKKKLKPLREPSLAGGEFFENPGSRKTRAVSPLESKLVEICGLSPLVGKKGFPGKELGKTLAVLRDQNAEPEELSRFMVWWGQQSMSYRSACPKPHQVARFFHESRPAAPEPAEDRCAPSPPPQPAEGSCSAGPEDNEDSPETEEHMEARWSKLDRRFVEVIITGQYDEARDAGDMAAMEKIAARFSRWFPGKPLPRPYVPE